MSPISNNVSSALRKLLGFILAITILALASLWSFIKDGRFPNLWFTNFIGAAITFLVLMGLVKLICRKLKFDQYWQFIMPVVLLSFSFTFLLHLLLYTFSNSLLDPISNFKDEDRHFTLFAYIYFYKISALVSAVFMAAFHIYWLIARWPFKKSIPLQ